ncbi:SMAD/FHA domain-containing protein [Baffinella frigidus]|nr:SMAD/FHA domain-containing protein [Cryptophyta sp. CCMP2293]
MSSEPPWACLPASHVSATLTSRGETLKIDDPMKKFYRMGRHQEMVDIHTASRVHAILAHHKDGGLYIFDLQSANGTFIDGIRVPPKKETRLRPGSKLRFGEADSPEYTIEDKRVDAKQGMLASLGGYGDAEEEEEEEKVPVKREKKREKDKDDRGDKWGSYG